MERLAAYTAELGKLQDELIRKKEEHVALMDAQETHMREQHTQVVQRRLTMYPPMLLLLYWR